MPDSTALGETGPGRITPFRFSAAAPKKTGPNVVINILSLLRSFLSKRCPNGPAKLGSPRSAADKRLREGTELCLSQTLTPSNGRPIGSAACSCWDWDSWLAARPRSSASKTRTRDVGPRRVAAPSPYSRRMSLALEYTPGPASGAFSLGRIQQPWSRPLLGQLVPRIS